MKAARFNRGLLKFLKASPTPFHAVARMADMLAESGFVRLRESDAWAIEKNGRYFVTRNGSALIAFMAADLNWPRTGIRMAGAHTDSPCLKVKPRPEILRHSFLQLGVEVYGGALLNPWFDRDLSLAGRVTVLSASGAVRSVLCDFGEAVAVIPSLAIHLDREANKEKSVNPQEELPPLLLQAADGEKVSFRDILLDHLKQVDPALDAVEVLDFEISLYDTHPPALVGLKQDLITGGRLDNLMSCYIGLTALMASPGGLPALLVCNDHEEVGSASAPGAQGPFLESVLARLLPAPEDRIRAIDRSMMVSADDAHGIHPNYAAKYDDNHGPLLNRGPVIKINAGQRYATGSETAALFRSIARRLDVPVQDFVMRSDLACGSTIGPLTATRVGVRTVDVGVPIFAMHSIRETAGVRDGHDLFLVLQGFFQAEDLTVSG
jgi:aspartyl aminopeptidase